MLASCAPGLTVVNIDNGFGAGFLAKFYAEDIEAADNRPQEALRAMGALQVDFLVPNRFDYGYGLSPEIVQLAAAMEPSVIVTVDNGVASVDGVALANASSIDVIVTDIKCVIFTFIPIFDNEIVNAANIPNVNVISHKLALI